MTIMSVGVLGLSASAIELTRTAKWADMAAAATALSTQQLELLRSMPLGSAGHATGAYTTGGTMKADGSANGPFTVYWAVSANDTPSWGLKTVTVTTAWTQYGSARSVQTGALVRCSTTPC